MPQVLTLSKGQTLAQIDRAFWCVHDHQGAMFLLGLPVLAAVMGIALGLAAVWRTWELSAQLNYFLVAVVVPWTALVLSTTCALPAAVFAWHVADGQALPPGACYAYCARRAGRLAVVMALLAVIWLGCLIPFGLLLPVYWPRTCLAPLIALFEDDRRVFRRSRRILRNNGAVWVIGSIFLAVLLVLAGLVFLPRLVLGTSMLGAHLVDDEWRRLILQYLWMFEALSGAVIIAALTMGWWISLTLLYHTIRRSREGADLRLKIEQLREKLVAS